MPNIVTQRHEWSEVDEPADNVTASVTRAANASGRHVCKSITVSVAGASAGMRRRFKLRDGITGVGTILWSASFLHLAGDSKQITVPNLNIVGSKNTAMTLEADGASGTGTIQTITFTGYTETDVVQETG